MNSTFQLYLVCGDGNLDQGVTAGTGEQCENGALGCNMTNCRCLPRWKPNPNAVGFCIIGRNSYTAFNKEFFVPFHPSLYYFKG
jgi:hypothetical protein